MCVWDFVGIPSITLIGSLIAVFPLDNMVWIWISSEFLHTSSRTSYIG